METTESTRTVQTPPSRRGSVVGGLLPVIGVILFVGATILQFAGGARDDWGQTFLANAIVYLIGWAGVGAGISHIFFGRRISHTIGFDKSPYELEVGFADLAMGIVALLASGYGPDFALAVILINTIFRVGCGIGHIRSMIRDRNFAINNTAILFIDFAVPTFLVATYYAVWG